MTQLEFAALAWGGSLAAGFLGSLAGLGGGVVIVPMLVLGFHVDMHYAIGASLISVIGTSAGAQAAHKRAGFSNTRLGLFLEIATTLGAICGAFLSTSTPTKWIAILFGSVLLYSASSSLGRKRTSLRSDLQMCLRRSSGCSEAIPTKESWCLIVPGECHWALG
jgi:uncharacterized protein